MADPTETLAAWRAVTEAATEGPWEVGDRYHVQGADFCACDPAYGPLVWSGRRDINGRVMKTHIHRRPRSLGNGDDTSIYGGSLPEPVVVALSTREYVEIAPENAAFIATARDAMPRLLAFAEAVLALHRPVEVEPSDTICSECSTRLPNGRYLPTVEWPCPTAALAERLGGEGR